MPFNCGNITLPYPNCYDLLEWCNNHYGTIIGWCNCMQQDLPKCKSDSTNTVLVFIIINIILLPIYLIILCFIVKFIHVSIIKCKSISKNNKKSETIDLLEVTSTKIVKQDDKVNKVDKIDKIDKMDKVEKDEITIPLI